MRKRRPRGRNVCSNHALCALAAAVRIHREVGVPATIFVVGCNIERLRPQLEACLASGWFEIAQHTHEHFPLKTVVEESPDNVYLPGLPFDRIEEQLARPVELLREHLCNCSSQTTQHAVFFNCKENTRLAGSR